MFDPDNLKVFEFGLRYTILIVELRMPETSALVLCYVVLCCYQTAKVCTLIVEIDIKITQAI